MGNENMERRISQVKKLSGREALLISASRLSLVPYQK